MDPKVRAQWDLLYVRSCKRPLGESEHGKAACVPDSSAPRDVGRCILPAFAAPWCATSQPLSVSKVSNAMDVISSGNAHACFQGSPADQALPTLQYLPVK